jgi:hypothetical protein
MGSVDIPEQISDAADAAGRNRFNRAVAVCVAAVAVCMALGNIKDGNIVQAMGQAQAAELDHWNQYQAKSTKQHLYELQLQQWQLQLAVSAQPPSALAALRIRNQLGEWRSEIARYETEKADLKRQADDLRREYDALSFRDDQFDFAEALLGLALTLFAVASLTQSRALLALACLMAAGGITMDLAAFMQWAIHPGIIRLLT